MALVTISPYVFPVAILKGLCVLCAQRHKGKIDQEEKGGVKGS